MSGSERKHKRYTSWPTPRLEARKDSVVAELLACAKADSPVWRTLPLERELAKLNAALVGR